MSALTSAAARSSRPLPAPSPRRRPHLRIVAPARNTKRYAVLSAAIAAAGIFGIVALHARAAEQSFQARALAEEVHELALRYDELTAEIAGLEAPERVRQVAVGQLGMVPAEQPGFLVAERHGAGDADSRRQGGTLQASAGDDVADPVKQVLAAGR
jgi:hypothetical protein